MGWPNGGIYLPVVVSIPWIDPTGQPRDPGTRFGGIPLSIYRAQREYFVREMVEATFHGRPYKHALSCGKPVRLAPKAPEPVIVGPLSPPVLYTPCGCGQK